MIGVTGMSLVCGRNLVYIYYAPVRCRSEGTQRDEDPLALFPGGQNLSISWRLSTYRV